MLDWHSCQICFPLEIKLLLFQYLAFCPKCLYDTKIKNKKMYKALIHMHVYECVCACESDFFNRIG